MLQDKSAQPLCVREPVDILAGRAVVEKGKFLRIELGDKPAGQGQAHLNLQAVFDDIPNGAEGKAGKEYRGAEKTDLDKGMQVFVKEGMINVELGKVWTGKVK